MLAHKEYVYQVLLTYNDGNVEKNWGNPKKNSKLWGGGKFFFLEFFGKN